MPSKLNEEMVADLREVAGSGASFYGATAPHWARVGYWQWSSVRIIVLLVRRFGEVDHRLLPGLIQADRIGAAEPCQALAGGTAVTEANAALQANRGLVWSHHVVTWIWSCPESTERQAMIQEGLPTSS
jgi:hypothetical protein